MAVSRRSYKGAPVSNTLGGSGFAQNATTINLATAMSGWPTGSEPFFVVVDPGTAKEEKICVIYSSTTSLTVVDPAVTSAWSASVNGRGADDTTDRAHDAGAAIYPVFTAREANDANRLTSAYANQGGIVYQGSSNPAQLAIGTAGQVLKVNSGATAPEWGQIGTTGIADSAITSGKIEDGTIVNADINASAAIALSKLATGSLPTDITVASANLVNGTIVEADLADSAVTSAKIADGTIVNADINASAAIALSKLATGALPTAITVASANIVNGSLLTSDFDTTTVVSSGGVPVTTVSTSAPSGGKDGDIWVQVV